MLETSFIMLSGAFLLVAICALPIFWQMWRVAKNTVVALETLNRSLPNILRNLEESTASLRSVASTLSQETEALTPLFQTIRTVLDLGKAVEGILLKGVQELTFGNKFKVVRGLLKGVKVFFEVFYDKHRQDSGEEKNSGQGKLWEPDGTRPCNHDSGKW